MDDNFVIRLGWISVLIGLILLYFLTVDDFEDGYFKNEDSRVELEINITKVNPGEEFNYFEGLSCRKITGFYNKELSKKNYLIKGDLYKGAFYVKKATLLS